MYASAYKFRERSVLIRLMLVGLGSRRYKTGTSGIGWR